MILVWGGASEQTLMQKGRIKDANTVNRYVRDSQTMKDKADVLNLPFSSLIDTARGAGVKCVNLNRTLRDPTLITTIDKWISNFVGLFPDAAGNLLYFFQYNDRRESYLCIVKVFQS